MADRKSPESLPRCPAFWRPLHRRAPVAVAISGQCRGQSAGRRSATSKAPPALRVAAVLAAAAALLRHAGRTVCANDSEIMLHHLRRPRSSNTQLYETLPNPSSGGQDTVSTNRYCQLPSSTTQPGEVALTPAPHRFRCRSAHTRMASTASRSHSGTTTRSCHRVVRHAAVAALIIPANVVGTTQHGACRPAH